MGRLALLTALAALLAPAAGAARTTTTVPAANVVVTLERDGVLDVLERVDVRAGAAYDASREVSMQRGELFAEPSVYVDGRALEAGDGRAAGTFRVSRGARGIELRWRQPPGSETVRLAYRLALLGTSYADVVDLRMPVWEGDWPAGVHLLTATVKLPRPTSRRIYAWVEPGSVAATIAKTRRDVRLTTHDVPAGKRITLHVVFPRAVLSSTAGTNVRAGPGLASILAERNGGRRWWPWALGGGIVLALSAAVLRATRSRRPPRR